MNERDFHWGDGERTIRYAADDLVRRSSELLAEHGWEEYALLSTERALGDAPPGLVEHAAEVHHVPSGPVNETGAALLGDVGRDAIVAFGGGRVIDTAKAIAAVRGGRVAAIPTTLSGAPMTVLHRLPEGAEAHGGLVRPVLVIADASAMVSLPEERLRATAMNALAHASDSLWTPYSNPVASEAGLRAAGMIASSLDAGPGREPHELGLGSILAGYAIDSQLFALHHVVCQTLVRVLRIPHAETNATMLPRTVAAMRGRAPAEVEALAAAIDTEPDRIEGRIEALGGGPRRLSEIGAGRDGIEAAIEEMLARPQLAFTPDPPGADELRELIESAW